MEGIVKLENPRLVAWIEGFKLTLRPRVTAGNLPLHVIWFPWLLFPVGPACMSSRRSLPKLGGRSRLALVLGMLGILGLLGIASGLEPEPSGLGTHRQLGLPPCSFQVRTGQPCPTCGMTTAFAWMVRGRLWEAWRAQPAGCLLFPVMVLLALWMLVSAIQGKPAWGARTLEGPLVGLVVATLALCLLAWTLRLLLE